MKVLVACEYSGRVRDAFRRRGHDAISCDLEPAEGDGTYHYQGDVFDVFQTRRFDLMIAHPPCTFLCNSGGRWLYKGGAKEVINAEGDLNIDPVRWQAMEDGMAFFRELQEAALNNNPNIKMAIENPIMHRVARVTLGRPAQYVQPWWFGDKAFKATGLHLTRLPLLVEDPKKTLRAIVPKPGTPEHKEWSKVHNASPGPNRWKERSRTYQGIADAMAEQWG